MRLLTFDRTNKPRRVLRSGANLGGRLTIDGHAGGGGRQTGAAGTRGRTGRDNTSTAPERRGGVCAGRRRGSSGPRSGVTAGGDTRSVRFGLFFCGESIGFSNLCLMKRKLKKKERLRPELGDPSSIGDVVKGDRRP